MSHCRLYPNVACVALRRCVAVLSVGLVLAPCESPKPTSPAPTTDAASADAIVKVVRDTVAQARLRSDRPGHRRWQGGRHARAIQTTTIGDLAATASGIGSGRLLSPESYHAMVSTQPGSPTCAELNDFYTYGLGIVISGSWLLQNPLLAGHAAVSAYLPSRKIAVAVTYDQGAFDNSGNYNNEADTLFRKIGAQLAPDDAPPLPPPK